ncbi:hypothetical protein BH23CHL5_BH23CHL5_03350 [soil metagenome]
MSDLAQKSKMSDKTANWSSVSPDEAVPFEATLNSSARTLALHIADIVTETPASNTVLLQITDISSIADFFLICSGENDRQLRAIAETINEELANNGIRPSRTEGTPQSGWIVMDFGDVIVHIFHPELREFYRMEQLWAEAPRVLSIQ